MRFEQVERFILAKKFFGGYRHFNSLNIVNVRVVLSASNIMHVALFCIHKPLSSNSL